MIKLSIKDIEKKLGKTIRQNSISVGFDVAPNYTGICIERKENLDKYLTKPTVLSANRPL